MTKRALVLAGGGCKGAYQLGVLSKLMGSQGRDYKILCGTSVGAINVAYLAQTPFGSPWDAFTRLNDLWSTVSTSKVYKKWFPFLELEALWKSSIYNSSPLQDWIRSGLDESRVRTSGHQLRIVSVSLNTGETRVVDETAKDLTSWVIASSAFPVMLTPVLIENQLWSNGGLRSVTPLGEAIRAGAEEIDMILCSNPFAKSPFDAASANAFPQMLLRAIDILSDEVARGDLRAAGDRNEIAELKPKYRKVKIRLFQPRNPITFDSLDFSPSNIQSMIRQGQEEADLFDVIGESSKTMPST